MTRLRWRELLPGLVAFAAIVFAAIYIVATGSVTSVHGRTVRIHVAISAARGITKGSEVRLAGSPIGMVNGIGFLPTAVDTSRRLVLDLDIHAEYAGNIRSDADVQLASGSTFIGAPVVEIGAGTPAGRVLSDGDTLYARSPMNAEEFASRATVAMRELPPLMANLKVLGAQMQSTEGTLGALGVGRGGAQATELEARVGALANDVSSGRGTIGLALDARTGISARARKAMAAVDSVRALLASDQAAVGRFRRDSSLLSAVGDLRDELSILQFRLNDPHGTVGRLHGDSAVVLGVADAQREMQQLFTDISRHPFRYVRP